LFRAHLIPAAIQIAGASALSHVVRLLPGRNIIGRDVLETPAPNTASRQNLCFEFDETVGELKVFAVEKSPYWIAPSADPSQLQPISTEYPTTLYNGDILTLSAESGVCRVSLDRVVPPTPPLPPSSLPPTLPPGSPGEGLRALENAVRRCNNGEPVPLRYYMDETFLVIYDQYPKSKIHLLVMPRDPRIINLNVLGPSHIPFLRGMVELGQRLMNHLRATQFPKTNMVSGLHGIPSLQPLHMHVMSLDLSTPFMKKKKHYNSFSTHFFLGAPGVLRELEIAGRVTSVMDRKKLEALEKGPMRCVWCEEPLPEMEKVKTHLALCSLNQSETK